MTILDHKFEAASSRVIGQQRLFEGCAIEGMKSLSAGRVDRIVTSPPYNLDIAYDRYDDGATRDDYLSWIDQAAAGMARVLATDGSLFLNMGSSLKDPTIPYQVMAVFQKYFVLQNNIIWTKSLWVEAAEKTFGHFKPINSPRFINHNFEHLFHFTHDGTVRLDRLAVGVPFEHASNIARFGHTENVRCRGNVWHLPYKTVRSRRTGRGNHPATFPESLPDMCLRLSGLETPRGPALVLDPFVGTGTTLVAAEKLGLPGLGFDVSADYLDFAEERIREQQTAAIASY
ncbi:DNA-methyltransferase [Loktanella sp. DJP18]|uniref:DNA-methyltransferase n=1 Tax=Loktanella sp. DJP18 TaxID=3409788 RepID=UPI003BB55CA9